jgi:hypothetical protein
MSGRSALAQLLFLVALLWIVTRPFVWAWLVGWPWRTFWRIVRRRR